MAICVPPPTQSLVPPSSLNLVLFTQQMACLSLVGVFGFGVGLSAGILIGYFVFIHFWPDYVQVPKIPQLAEYHSDALQRMLLEIPSWMKFPDVDRAVCSMAKDIAKPIIAQQMARYNIESFEKWIVKQDNGVIVRQAAGRAIIKTPEKLGMKVYDTDEKEVILEPYFKWAGNPNITVAVKAFGLKATVQVIENLPHIDFGLKFLGLDVMSIPGLYQLLQEIIKKQITNMYLWPRKLEMQILDPIKDLKKPVGILHVWVVRASNLKKKDLLGKSDPYVKLKLTEDKFPSKKTTVKHNNLNPEWNEEFKMVVKDPQSQALEIRVGKHDKIGMNVIPLKDLPPYEPQTFTLELLRSLDTNSPPNEKSRGQIVVRLTFIPFEVEKEDLGKDSAKDSNEVEKAHENSPSGGGLLVVIVHEAEDLEGKHNTNPYAKILFRGEERKTKHIKKNRDPRWEEEFQFVLEEPPTNDRAHIEIQSKPSSICLHPKETLGYVDINLADVVRNKRTTEKYHLIGSKNGKIRVELQWRA
ncbi:hypothetical protein ACLOJK_028036 [Asimina triloba]